MALFNRVSNRKEKHFFMICQMFQEQGLNTVDAANTFRTKVVHQAKVFAVVIAIIGLVLAGIFSSLAAQIIVITLAILFYVVMSACRTREMLQRYIDEILPLTTEDTESRDSIARK